jgi:cysteine-rich repeat protein
MALTRTGWPIALWAVSLVAGCSLPHAAWRPDAAEDAVAEASAEDAADVVELDRVDLDADASIDAEDARDADSAAQDATDAMDAAEAAADAGRDASADAQPDAARDGGALDASRDSGSDARVDGGSDAACGAGQTLCAGGCVDTRTDRFNCGACGRTCATSSFGFATCEAGFCALRCNAGYRYTESGGETPVCASDATSAADACPGQDIAVAPDSTTTIVGTTSGRRSLRAGSAPCNALVGPEAYFQITSRANGTLRLSLSSLEPLGMYVLSGACADGVAGSMIACGYQPVTAISRGRTQGLVLEATVGQVFTVVVDSPTATGQAFALRVTHENNCGLATEGLPVGPRACGDRNVSAGDGCSATCEIEAGVVLTGCPSAMARPTAVRVDATPVFLDGRWMGAGGAATCGAEHTRAERIYALDVVNPAELRIELDPRAQARTALSVRRATSCGSIIGEECANVVGDTATGERIDVRTTVANERLWLVADSDTDTSYQLRIMPRSCGDGRLGPSEECDDGNALNGDGCDASCHIEAGCALSEGADTTLMAPMALPTACRTTRMSATLNPTGMDADDAARVFLRAGEAVVYQLSSGGQGRCPVGLDPVLEISQGTSASIPMPRNNECAPGAPSVCVDDSATYCPEGVFVVPADDWYTFRVFRYRDVAGSFAYELLLNRR